MSVTGRLSYILIGVAIATLFFSFAPFVIHDGGEFVSKKVFIKVPSSDFTIDCGKKEVSMRGQDIQYQDKEHRLQARLSIASNAVELDNIKISDTRAWYKVTTRDIVIFITGALVSSQIVR